MSGRDWCREHEGSVEEHAVDVEVQARLENDPDHARLTRAEQRCVCPTL